MDPNFTPLAELPIGAPFPPPAAEGLSQASGLTPLFALLIYMVISLAATIWVGRTLHRNGRIFLLDAFDGRSEMADAVNTLLLVGFYLLNAGFVALFLRFFDKPQTALAAVEYLATKLGIVLLVLGALHFFNMFNFAKMRAKRTRPRLAST